MSSVTSCENAQNFKHAQFIISCTVLLWATYISFQAELLQYQRYCKALNTKMSYVKSLIDTLLSRTIVLVYL